MYVEHKSMSRSQIERLRKQYPKGTRIKLQDMAHDIDPVAPGTLGTVEFIDDIGQIHMKWDNGRTLALAPGVDQFSAIE